MTFFSFSLLFHVYTPPLHLHFRLSAAFVVLALVCFPFSLSPLYHRYPYLAHTPACSGVAPSLLASYIKACCSLHWNFGVHKIMISVASSSVVPVRRLRLSVYLVSFFPRCASFLSLLCTIVLQFFRIAASSTYVWLLSHRHPPLIGVLMDPPPILHPYLLYSPLIQPYTPHIC
jgi:hypothetical protein